jgi:DNA-binding transcriptional regulator YhcF (GntR family)
VTLRADKSDMDDDGPVSDDGVLVRIDEGSPVPPYEQVRAQLATQIVDGLLVAGVRLPPVRRLADELGLAANTVARSYRELEAVGLVETRGRGGTVVSTRGNVARERLLAAATSYAAVANELGIAADEALRAVEVALRPTR